MGENKEIKVRLSTVVYLFIIVVLVVALGVVYYFGFIANKKIETGNDKIANIATENETNKENDIEKEMTETTNNVNWKSAYVDKLSSSKTSDDYKVEYYFADIDRNGIPELMLEKYTSEADRKIEVYTYNNNSIIYLGDFGSSQMLFYKMNNKDYLFGVYGHMGYEETYKIYINNNYIKKESLGEGRTISPDEGYVEGDILLEKANWNETYLIENYN